MKVFSLGIFLDFHCQLRKLNSHHIKDDVVCKLTTLVHIFVGLDIFVK